MRAFIAPFACMAFVSAQAQQIDAYRYWFDDDDGSIVTTTVSSTTELTLADAWPTNGLEPGFHTVSFQVRDTNGDWSVPHSTLFARSASDIVGYRYWVNDDAANLTTGTISPNDVVDLNSVIDPGTLPKDYNTVTILFRDADGEWTVPQIALFVKNTGMVNGYQYWIDDDVANLTGGSIGPDNVVDLITDLPTPTTNGDHVFTIRFSSVNGTWSVPLSSSFTFVVGLEELPGISDLLLFPNPANEQLSLRITNANTRPLRISIMDATGREVRAEQEWPAIGTATRHWDLSGLAAGSYRMRIALGGHQTTLPFQKY